MVASGIFKENIKRKTTDPVLSQANQMQQNTSVYTLGWCWGELIGARGDKHSTMGSMKGRWTVTVQIITILLRFLLSPNQEINIKITLRLGEPIRS